MVISAAAGGAASTACCGMACICKLLCACYTSPFLALSQWISFAAGCLGFVMFLTVHGPELNSTIPMTVLPYADNADLEMYAGVSYYGVRLSSAGGEWLGLFGLAVSPWSDLPDSDCGKVSGMHALLMTCVFISASFAGIWDCVRILDKYSSCRRTIGMLAHFAVICFANFLMFSFQGSCIADGGKLGLGYWFMIFISCGHGACLFLNWAVGGGSDPVTDAPEEGNLAKEESMESGASSASSSGSEGQ